MGSFCGETKRILLGEMMKKLLIILTIILAVLFMACSKSSLKISYNPEIEYIMLNHSIKDSSLFFSVKTNDPQGYEDVKTVVYWMYYTPNDTIEEIEYDINVLLDDGTKGDIIENDKIFTREFHNIKLGRYRIIAEAYDQDDHVSGVMRDTVWAINNTPPIIYLQKAPYTFEKGDNTTFEIKVNDNQGIEDIFFVKVKIRQPDGNMMGRTDYMRDDGAYGDKVPKDGVYTISFPTNKNSKQQGIWKFYFQAKDKNDSWSNQIEKTVLNPGVAVLYPDSSKSFKQDEEINIQWDSAIVDTVIVEYTSTADLAYPSYKFITEQPAHIKEYTWTIPNDVESKYCKIRVYDKEKHSRADTSDEFFEVSK